MAAIISFINFKGGVGKTTLCVEIGASLASKFDTRVLIVDLDPQTNATLALMTEDEWRTHASSKGTLKDFFDACYSGTSKDLEQIIVPKPVDYHGRLDRLDLLPSHIELFGMDLRLATKYGHENIRPKLFLRRALEGLRRSYDYILIDCPPNLYLATQTGLFASGHYLIVALAEYLSTLGIAHIQRSVRDIFVEAQELLADAGASTALMAEPKLLGIIFNRVRYMYRGTGNEEAIMQQIRAQYGQNVFNTFVPQSTNIADRPQVKVPIAVSGYAADQRYEERLRAVAEEFYERITRPGA